MKGIYKFIKLSSIDRRLLVKSAFLLGAVRLGLWLLPFQTLRSLLKIMAPSTIELQERASIEKFVWAVVVVSRYMPAVMSCLAQALTVEVLLSRSGYPARLRIGVAQGEEGELEAHAWVESDGRIVSGGTGCLSRYTLLPPLGGERL